MNKKLKNSLRFLFVAVGVVLLTSFTIDATDTLSGSQTALSIFAKKIAKEGCEKDMILVEGIDNSFCIDKYEASPSTDCIFPNPASIVETTHNIAAGECFPISVSNQLPWTFLAKPQAEQLCAKVQKSLPTAKEWYQASVGTPDNQEICNLNGANRKTGTSEKCLSGVGAFDMIGNVWEIVADEVVGNKYNDRELPPEGYVNMIDVDGVAQNTTSTPNPVYNNDYFWVEENGNFSILKGGYYGSRQDGGIYSTYAKTSQDFASAAIGFRCVKRTTK